MYKLGLTIVSTSVLQWGVNEIQKKPLQSGHNRRHIFHHHHLEFLAHLFATFLHQDMQSLLITNTTDSHGWTEPWKRSKTIVAEDGSVWDIIKHILPAHQNFEADCAQNDSTKEQSFGQSWWEELGQDAWAVSGTHCLKGRPLKSRRDANQWGCYSSKDNLEGLTFQKK